jgi:DNA-binding transcriptional MerR regulator
VRPASSEDDRPGTKSPFPAIVGFWCSANCRKGEQNRAAVGRGLRVEVMKDRLYTVGELAGELEVTPRALRFYEDCGLIRPRRNGQNRIYTRRDRARLILILRGKRLGFSLAEVKEWLDLYDADPLQLAQTRHLAARIDARLTQLEQQRSDLEATLAELRKIRAQVDAHLANAHPLDVDVLESGVPRRQRVARSA